MGIVTRITCVVCGSKLVAFWGGFFCEGCGIHYNRFPSKKIREKLRKEKESILRMSPRAKKKFAKKLDKIQANLNHSKRMK